MIFNDFTADDFKIKLDENVMKLHVYDIASIMKEIHKLVRSSLESYLVLRPEEDEDDMDDAKEDEDDMNEAKEDEDDMDDAKEDEDDWVDEDDDEVPFF
jgi:hypothetical protein